MVVGGGVMYLGKGAPWECCTIDRGEREGGREREREREREA